MRIKLIRKKEDKRKRSGILHYWLVPEQPRRKKRLPQLNKSRKIAKSHSPKSEFLLMAERMEGK